MNIRHATILITLAFATCAEREVVVGPAPIKVCPHPGEWTAAEQQKVVNEIGKLGPNSATARAIGGYINLRDQARKCRESKS